MLDADAQAAVTRRAVEAFCREFVAHPYPCYTEHGLHAPFFTRLYAALPEHGRYAVRAESPQWLREPHRPRQLLRRQAHLAVPAARAWWQGRVGLSLEQLEADGGR